MKYLLSTVLILIGFTTFAQVASPPAPEIESIEVYKVVEEMPRFPGCEDISENQQERIQCANGKLAEYISTNL